MRANGLLVMKGVYRRTGYQPEPADELDRHTDQIRGETPLELVLRSCDTVRCSLIVSWCRMLFWIGCKKDIVKMDISGMLVEGEPVQRGMVRIRESETRIGQQPIDIPQRRLMVHTSRPFVPLSRIPCAPISPRRARRTLCSKGIARKHALAGTSLRKSDVNVKTSFQVLACSSQRSTLYFLDWFRRFDQICRASSLNDKRMSCESDISLHTLAPS